MCRQGDLGGQPAVADRGAGEAPVMHVDPPRLVCFPFAGAGASFYQPWQAALEGTAKVVAAQLPGREARIAEPLLTRSNEAVDDLVAGLREELRGSRVLLFGHCFLGAVLAFEVARRLEPYDDIEVVHLVVSAARAPQHSRSYGSAGLGDQEFVTMVKTLTEYEHSALDIPELRDLLLPVFRADFAIDEGYRSPESGPLRAPISALVAVDDRAVEPRYVEGWARWTSHFSTIEVEGGHMYLAEDPSAIHRLIGDLVRPDGSTGGAP